MRHPLLYCLICLIRIPKVLFGLFGLPPQSTVQSCPSHPPQNLRKSPATHPSQPIDFDPLKGFRKYPLGWVLDSPSPPFCSASYAECVLNIRSAKLAKQTPPLSARDIYSRFSSSARTGGPTGGPPIGNQSLFSLQHVWAIFILNSAVVSAESNKRRLPRSTARTFPCN